MVGVVDGPAVLLKHKVRGGDVGIPQLHVKTLDGKIALALTHFAVSKHQQGMLGPAKMSTYMKAKLTQFFVRRACVSNGGVDLSTEEADCWGPCRDHG